MNMKRMSEDRRSKLLNESVTWQSIQELADEFTQEYEAATSAAPNGGGNTLPFLSSSGFWLQSYGFSKACLNAYCAMLAREHPLLVSVSCSPGFVNTDMVKT